MPVSKDLDPNLGLDRDEKKLDVYLGLHKNSLLVSTLYIFLPFTISLDPQIRKEITGRPGISGIVINLTVLHMFALHFQNNTNRMNKCSSTLQEATNQRYSLLHHLT